MIVGLDTDGVVADFLSPFLQSFEQKTGNGPIPPESITDLNFKEHPYLKEEIVWQCLEDLSYSPGFWGSLTSLVRVEEWQKLDELSRQERLVFITHRYERETYSIHAISYAWLHRQGAIRSFTSPKSHRGSSRNWAYRSSWMIVTRTARTLPLERTQLS